MIRVVHCKVENNCEYIGRPSALGNPFAIGASGTREEVVLKYRNWIISRIKEKDMEIINELKRLKSLAKKGELKLGCWCAPRACHGDVIKELLERSIRKELNK
jgi:hypothetical protein